MRLPTRGKPSPKSTNSCPDGQCPVTTEQSIIKEQRLPQRRQPETLYIKGEPGKTGSSGKDGVNGVGVPPGGTTGQILAKATNSNYDTEWVNDSASSHVHSITDITGTEAEFNAAVTDGDFLFVGDIIQYTAEMAQDAVGGILTDTAEINFTYNDVLDTITADIVAGSIDETKLDASVNASLDLADSSLQAANISDIAYAPSWDGVLTVAPSKNAVYDIIESVISGVTVTLGATPFTGGTAGSVLFIGPGPVVAQDNALFFWDDTNNRLGIGTATPTMPLHVEFNHATDVNVATFRNTHATGGARIAVDKGADASIIRSSLVQHSQNGTNIWVTGIPRRGGSSHGNLFTISTNADINAGGGEFVINTSGNTSIGGSYALVSIAKLSVVGNVAGTPVFIARGAAAQSANLQEWQNSVGTLLLSITSAGYISGSSEIIFSVGGNALYGINGTGYIQGSGRMLQWANGAGAAGATGDLFVGREGAANIRLGSTVANPPIAQTLSVQNASGTDIAGATFTIASSRATGNAVGGAIVFQTSDVGASSATLQSLTTKMTLLASGYLGIGTTNPLGKLAVENVGGYSGLILQDSGYAHGMTNIAATDIFAAMIPYGSNGGAYLLGINNSTGQSGVVIDALNVNTSGNTAPVLNFYASVKNGISSTSVPATEEAFGFNTGSTRLITILGNGNFGVNTTTPGAQIHVKSSAATNIGLLVQGAVVQTFAILDVQNSAGTSLFNVFQTIASASVDITVPDEAYGVGWDASFEVPTKNALYDKIETIVAGTMAIGNPVVSGTSGSILYVNSSNQLAQNNSDLFFNASTSAIGIGTNTTGFAKLQINSHNATYTGIIVRGFAAQSATLQEWQNSSSTVLSSISSAGYFGVGQTAAVPVHVTNSNDASSFWGISVGTATNSARSVALFQATTSNNMADGFGPVIQFVIKDNLSADEPIGYFGAIRDGADNSGAFKFFNYNAGVAFNSFSITSSGRAVAEKFLNYGTPTELTIAAGVITATKSLHTVDTEADAASDDLDTINGGIGGDILIISADNTARTVVVKNGTGNIRCGTDMSLDSAEDTMTLMYNPALMVWVEISRSNNA